jgi:hypothetical protein
VSTFWQVVVFLFIFVPLVMLWVFALLDLFKRRDLSGWAKGLWAIAIVIFPIVGMVVYFVARPKDLEDEYVQVGSRVVDDDLADQLERLAALRDSGKITEDEFSAQKTRLLAG